VVFGMLPLRQPDIAAEIAISRAGRLDLARRRDRIIGRPDSTAKGSRCHSPDTNFRGISRA
jgi:hypothetical protein